MYYEDRQTGSIYSVWELRDLSRAGEVGMEVLSHGLRQLPYSTVLLLEEAETIAANAAEQRERAWLDRLRD